MKIEEKIKIVPGLAIMCIGCYLTAVYSDNPFAEGTIAKYLGFALFVAGIIFSLLPFTDGIILIPGIGTLGSGVLVTATYSNSNGVGGLLAKVFGYLLIIGGVVLIYAILDEIKKPEEPDESQ